jgi:hypothetical protein
MKTNRCFYLVSGLWSLVNSHSRRDTNKISLKTQITTEINGISTIQSTGCVVPALELCSREGSLSDANALALAAAHTPDEVIAHAGVDGVADAEDGHHDIAHHGVGFGARDAPRDVAQGVCAGGEREGLANGQMGEMAVYLGVVEDVSSKGRAYVVFIDT